LREVLESDNPDARCYAAEGAKLVGQLSLVPAMLEAWNRAETIHELETIGFGISNILEPELGEIANQVGIQDTKPPRAPTPDDSPSMVWLLERRARNAREALEDPAPFPGLVTDAYDALRANLGDHAFVWKGEPLSVSKLVNRLLTAAKHGERGIGTYLPLRHRLEAWTGFRRPRSQAASHRRPRFLPRVHPGCEATDQEFHGIAIAARAPRTWCPAAFARKARRRSEVT